ncbi:STAS domain-containing protein [Streptomyces sp. YC504]|uniref:STAS domain-containing protein n=1 Tax=Streptomyces mesophilus TaxID=1775132 RepID=A0A6G4XEX0_9ACTN|nr:STAS domain-containing protein [Streptomyces mesophilus]NGO76085.1 STAS domain-containing protein [Streptomyces mesophilus]
MSSHPDLSEVDGQLVRPVLFDDCRVVRAHGELDLLTVAPLVRALNLARTGRGRLCLIVDLSEVTFADGSILGPLSDAWADCRERHGWVRVVYTTSATALLFRAGGLADRFPGYASARDAWRGVAEGPGTASRPMWGKGA